MLSRSPETGFLSRAFLGRVPGAALVTQESSHDRCSPDDTDQEERRWVRRVELYAPGWLGHVATPTGCAGSLLPASRSHTLRGRDRAAARARGTSPTSAPRGPAVASPPMPIRRS